MMTEIKLSDAIGKQLTGVAFSYTSNQAVLVFHDDTVAAIGATWGYPGEETLNIFDFGDDKLVQLRIATSYELEELRKARDIKNVKINELRERNEYERLKAKYDQP